MQAFLKKILTSRQVTRLQYNVLLCFADTIDKLDLEGEGASYIHSFHPKQSKDYSEIDERKRNMPWLKKKNRGFFE